MSTKFAEKAKAIIATYGEDSGTTRKLLKELNEKQQKYLSAQFPDGGSISNVGIVVSGPTTKQFEQMHGNMDLTLQQRNYLKQSKSRDVMAESAAYKQWQDSVMSLQDKKASTGFTDTTKYPVAPPRFASPTGRVSQPETIFANGGRVSISREMHNGVVVEREHAPTLEFVKQYVAATGNVPPLDKFAKSIAVDHEKDFKNVSDNPQQSYYQRLIDNKLSDEKSTYALGGTMKPVNMSNEQFDAIRMLAGGGKLNGKTGFEDLIKSGNFKDNSTTTDRFVDRLVNNSPQIAPAGESLKAIANMLGAPINYATGSLGGNDAYTAMMPILGATGRAASTVEDAMNAAYKTKKVGSAAKMAKQASKPAENIAENIRSKSQLEQLGVNENSPLAEKYKQLGDLRTKPTLQASQWAEQDANNIKSALGIGVTSGAVGYGIKERKDWAELSKKYPEIVKAYGGNIMAYSGDTNTEDPALQTNMYRRFASKTPTTIAPVASAPLLSAATSVAHVAPITQPTSPIPQPQKSYLDLPSYLQQNNTDLSSFVANKNFEGIGKQGVSLGASGVPWQKVNGIFAGGVNTQMLKDVNPDLWKKTFGDTNITEANPQQLEQWKAAVESDPALAGQLKMNKSQAGYKYIGADWLNAAKQPLAPRTADPINPLQSRLPQVTPGLAPVPPYTPDQPQQPTGEIDNNLLPIIAGALPTRRPTPLDNSMMLPRVNAQQFSPDMLSTAPIRDQLNDQYTTGVGTLSGTTGGSASALRSNLQGLNRSTGRSAGEAFSDIYGKNTGLKNSAEQYNLENVNRANEFNAKQGTTEALSRKQTDESNLELMQGWKNRNEDKFAGAMNNILQLNKGNADRSMIERVSGYDSKTGNKIQIDPKTGKPFSNKSTNPKDILNSLRGLSFKKKSSKV